MAVVVTLSRPFPFCTSHTCVCAVLSKNHLSIEHSGGDSTGLPSVDTGRSSSGDGSPPPLGEAYVCPGSITSPIAKASPPPGINRVMGFIKGKASAPSTQQKP